jgi:hypothetical protein
MTAVETPAAKYRPPPTASPMAATVQMLAAVVFTARQYRTGAEKANSGDHLCGYTGWVKDDVWAEHGGETVGRDDHEKARPHADKHVGADAGGPKQALAFETN